MGQLITQACLENQANAARWYQRGREWLQASIGLDGYAARTACQDFAKQDQQDAARLSRADRLLRGLEA